MTKLRLSEWAGIAGIIGGAGAMIKGHFRKQALDLKLLSATGAA